MSRLFIVEGGQLLFSQRVMRVRSGTMELGKDNGNSWNDIVEPALAIVGLGNAYREPSEGSKFIELIATNDIDDFQGTDYIII